MRRRTTTLVIANLLLLCVALPFVERSFSSSYGFGSPGTNDFIQYWTAYQLFSAGQDPYDSKKTREIQRRHGRSDAKVFLTWTPPWLLVLMSPVLRFDFLAAARLWFLTNVLLLLGAAGLAWRGSNASSNQSSRRGLALLLCVGVAALFYPCWDTLLTGQVSLLIAFGVAGAYAGLKRQQDTSVGLFLLLTTIKPHLVYLVGIALGWWALLQKRYRIFLSFGIGAMLLAVTVLLVAPSALRAWADRFVTGAATEVPVEQWRVATLMDPVRQSVRAVTGQYAAWPMVAIPLVAIAVLALVLWRRPTQDWTLRFPWLIGCSLFTSPYGWLFDQSTLIVALAASVSLALSPQMPTRRRALALSSVAVATLAPAVAKVFFLRSHHQFFWVPPLVMVSMYGCQRAARGKRV